MKLGAIGKVKKRYWVVAVLVGVMVLGYGLLTAPGKGGVSEELDRLMVAQSRTVLRNAAGSSLGEFIPGWPQEVTFVEMKGPLEVEDIKLLTEFKKLEVLRWDHVPITEPVVNQLKGFESLEGVRFDPPVHVTQEGLRALDTLPESIMLLIDSLYIDSRSMLTEEGLALIENVPALSGLHLAGEAIDDLGLAAVAKISRLTVLDLENVAVTDEGLAVLIGMENLTVLTLIDMKVADGVVETIEQIKRLKLLILEGNVITEAGLARLKESRPDITVRSY